MATISYLPVDIDSNQIGFYSKYRSLTGYRVLWLHQELAEIIKNNIEFKNILGIDFNDWKIKKIRLDIDNIGYFELKIEPAIILNYLSDRYWSEEELSDPGDMIDAIDATYESNHSMGRRMFKEAFGNGGYAFYTVTYHKTPNSPRKELHYILYRGDEVMRFKDALTKGLGEIEKFLKNYIKENFKQ